MEKHVNEKLVSRETTEGKIAMKGQVKRMYSEQARPVVLRATERESREETSHPSELMSGPLLAPASFKDLGKYLHGYMLSQQ